MRIWILFVPRQASRWYDIARVQVRGEAVITFRALSEYAYPSVMYIMGGSDPFIGRTPHGADVRPLFHFCYGGHSRSAASRFFSDDVSFGRIYLSFPPSIPWFAS
jgi:hypothetical protein